MKNLILFSISLFILSCSNPPAKKVVEAKPPSIDMTDNCIVACQNETPFELTKACGECIIERYTEIGSSVFSPQKVQGFQVAHQELLDIVAAMANDSTAMLYAMLAVKETVDDGDTIISPELVFQVQKEKPTGGYVSSYWDFTVPCPNTCPKTQ